MKVRVPGVEKGNAIGDEDEYIRRLAQKPSFCKEFVVVFPLRVIGRH